MEQIKLKSELLTVAHPGGRGAEQLTVWFTNASNTRWQQSKIWITI